MRKSTGTVTSAGVVKHRRHPAGFDMPVKLAGKKLGKDPDPLVRDGRLVFALPGGGEWLAS